MRPSKEDRSTELKFPFCMEALLFQNGIHAFGFTLYLFQSFMIVFIYFGLIIIVESSEWKLANICSNLMLVVLLYLFS